MRNIREANVINCLFTLLMLLITGTVYVHRNCTERERERGRKLVRLRTVRIQNPKTLDFKSQIVLYTDPDNS